MSTSYSFLAVVIEEPQRGDTPLSQTNARAESAAPHRSSYYLLFVFTQGSISGFALIPPSAMQSIVPTALVMRLDFDAVALFLGKPPHYRTLSKSLSLL